MSRIENSSLNPGDKKLSRDNKTLLPDELTYFEANLAALRPRDDRLNRDRIMFLAGQAFAEASLYLRHAVLAVPATVSRTSQYVHNEHLLCARDAYCSDIESLFSEASLDSSNLEPTLSEFIPIPHRLTTADWDRIISELEATST